MSSSSPAGARTPLGPWNAELVNVVRAASGGLLFGVPLLYTMEVWWIGSHTEPRQMLLLLALLGVALLALNMTAGFRTTRDVRILDACTDVVQALAVGIIVTAVVLILLRELTLDTPTQAALGKVLRECVPFCLGIGVARLLLEGDPGMDDGDEPDSNMLNASVADIGATALGAAFVGLSIAPTDEVPMLASAISPAWQLVLMAASLATSYAIVFVAGFARQDVRRTQNGVFQRPVVETVVTYLLALLVSALLLWAFQRNLHPAGDLLTRVVVLGFPAAVGGAVGRLAL